MNPPSLREICALATKGPWHTYDGTLVRHGEETIIARIGRSEDSHTRETFANAKLIARFSPATALAVYEALDYSMRALASTVYANQIDLGTSGDNATRIADNHDAVKQARHALALLDGRTEP